MGLGPRGELLASAALLAHARDFGVARVTQAAMGAAPFLEHERSAAIARAASARLIASGKLGVDVLSQPLFPYQREGVSHLVRAGRAVLADDMGLGKTVQTTPPARCCAVAARRSASSSSVLRR